MTEADDDPHCPECGEPIGQTATYCMHCSAELTEEKAAADADGDGAWDTDADSAATGTGPGETASADTDASWTSEEGGKKGEGSDVAGPRGQLIDPDGTVDNTLTVIVGIAGGLVIGILATVLAGLVFQSLPALLGGGVAAWILSTAYLVRRRTVQGALSRSAYGVALVVLLFVALPIKSLVRTRTFEPAALLFIVLGATVPALVGYLASWFVPDELAGSEG
ncbi:hypothetical protein BRD17_04790 [Halobacteriales archaeon SW_7_68_16]|nr:MAG: hypothetical protein BRD17_04790 [Halobacteriales archaeon SW_7_68_16]